MKLISWNVNGVRAVQKKDFLKFLAKNQGKGFILGYGFIEGSLEDHENQMLTIAACVVYPQPHNLYTVHNGKTGETYTDLDLEWATPTLSVVHRPKLCGMHIKKLDDKN